MSVQERDTLLKSLNDELNSKSSLCELRYFYSEYLSWAENECSAKYCRSISDAFKHCMDFFGGEKPMMEISVRDVENLKVYLKAKAPKGYPVYLRNLKAAFNKALIWDYLKENPFLKVKIDRLQKEKPIFILQSVLNQILQIAENETIRNIINFAFYTGCRLSEIINLRWQNVNLEKKMLTIGDEKFQTKTRQSRDIPICKQIYPMLDSMYSARLISPLPTAFVFTKGNGFRYNSDYVSKSFKKLCRELKLDERIHFHTLRHSFTSHLIIGNVNIYTISKLLGHSSVKTTEIYAHLSDEALFEAMNAFDIAA